ncbi:alpha/beta fold hydrolase [Oscillatoria sp. FACHB-1407]|uniref:alpha/beta hydrolase n=1 Tax=Oscillatoria sp. FACHB-1407 TaxID=2692847 RepID=UPI00168A2CE2|nr:alpha/beta fold hydrolase [Oscillatoria sp. FACHB-1407]MBD2459779.1 alpha/beta fold hydrolase [Oscillatoria sp. FACHB-1407]
MVAISQSIATLIQQIHENESVLPLRNEACRSRFYLHPHETSKVFLFLHGFTAAPYQFDPIGQAFFEAGYNVLVPLQPGHGQAGEWNRHNPPPLPTDIDTYQWFLLDWLEIAQSLGQQVIVGGLSTGGTLAAWLALNHPQQIDRALLFTPFLASRYRLFDWLIHWLPIYFEWFNKNASGNFGYKGFYVPALRIFLQLAQDVVKQANTKTSAPVLMVCSEGDRAVNQAKQQALFQSVVARQPKCWYYCFDDSLHIEHRMMTKLEDNDYEDLVITLARAYVESDLTWTQFQQIARQVAQANSGEAMRNPTGAIAHTFNLDTQLATNLQAMMTQAFGCQHLECISPPDS